MSDDGTRAISIIAFIGSVFSPWYAWSGRGDPENHVCLNVATYGRGGRFAMTDRGRAALRQSAQRMRIGPSSIGWNGTQLVAEIDEISALPRPTRVRGYVRLTPSFVTGVELPLTGDGAHVWRPFAPAARIEVDLEATGWQWNGHGYLDANFGTRPLEADFSHWTWARFPDGDGARCFYSAQRRAEGQLNVAARFDADGHATLETPPPERPMRRSLWGVRRTAHGDTDSRPRQVKPMLDAPFYSRSVVETTLDGVTRMGVHEALDLDRYGSRWLKPMIALRVPRRRGWTFPD
ncbi:carotenoid 1,2-hydratase [Roseivivax marinus]|uniref:carotenoid 1,2-hydratase n=1 Tax=Roseivivax marinus TaxID=1379903 RepID=UPI00273F1CD2|nr:carotenoid 1,2-hydratase [Roseivivax marinus]